MSFYLLFFRNQWFWSVCNFELLTRIWCVGETLLFSELYYIFWSCVTNFSKWNSIQYSSALFIILKFIHLYYSIDKVYILYSKNKNMRIFFNLKILFIFCDSFNVISKWYFCNSFDVISKWYFLQPFSTFLNNLYFCDAFLGRMHSLNCYFQKNTYHWVKKNQTIIFYAKQNAEKALVLKLWLV